MATKEAGIATARQPRIVSSSKRSEPTNEQIAARAYEIFLTRGGTHGSDLEDWLQAERELRRAN
jgi:hypothetical protein